MPVNDYLAFAVGEDANVMDQEDYAALSALESGFQTGVASSQQLNKVWRQASVVAATVAQFICDNQSGDVLDDGDVPAMVVKLGLAIQAFLGGSSSTVLPGTISIWPKNTAPSGYLECAGQAVSRTTYAALFAVIGTTFGVGDGSDTFNVPDLRAEFVRGWDHGRGVDTGRTFGSAQSDELKAHSHDFMEENTGSAGSGGAIDASSDLTGDTNDFAIQETGGTETRPRNIALMYIIKT